MRGDDRSFVRMAVCSDAVKVVVDMNEYATQWNRLEAAVNADSGILEQSLGAYAVRSVRAV
jgi:hypothetical protein